MVNVGRFILNFGVLEFASHMWVAELSSNNAVIRLAVDLSFAKRVGLLLSLVEEARMPKKWKKEAHHLWATTRAIAIDRNLLAHSPIAFVWRGRPAEGPADIVGIPNLKKLTAGPEHSLPVTPLPADLPERVNALAEVVRRLQSSLESFRVRVDARKAGPAGAA